MRHSVGQIITFFAALVAVSSDSRFFNLKRMKHMTSYIDVNANPCEDLYQYACGKWSEKHDIQSEDNDYTSVDGMVNFKINKELSEFMSVMSSRNKSEFVLKSHTFFKSCVDIKEYNLKIFMEKMTEYENMTWALRTPAAEAANHKFDWVQTLALLRRYGLNGVFIEEQMFERYDDSWRTIIDLNKPFENGGFTSLTEDDFNAINSDLELPEEQRPFGDMLDGFKAFEKLLKALDEVKDDDGDNYITVKELPLPWLYKYLGIVLNENLLDLNMDIEIENIPYMKALDALLNEYDDYFLCSYLELRFLWHLYQTPQVLYAVDCMAATRGLLSLPMNWIFEKQHPELRQEFPKIAELFYNILDSVQTTLSTDKSGIVTPKALSILKGIQLKVGNLPRMDTERVLNNFYADLTLDSKDFYGNLLQLHKFNFNVSHSGYGNYLTGDINQLFFVDSYNEGASYLPYYLKAPNVVVAPTTVMRQPFYHWGYDNVYKYSSLGVRFAYLIIEAVSSDFNFDDLMYSDLVKIGEIASIHAAYGAYYATLPDTLKDDEAFIKGTRLIFFLNYAQQHCHASDATTLNSYVSHFPSFAEAFDCQLRNFIETLIKKPSSKI
uniref:Peptidase M13 N-terminal domain-containing protein n=1 Tax=Stomoxys calcitrans TaxID=35570 RepID=A0A1I8PFS3_STOCA